MRALVTGSAGFVGRHMVEELLERGWAVDAIDVRVPEYGWQADLLTYLPGETTVFDLVVHAAARSPHRAAIDTAPGMHVYNSLLDAAVFDWAIRTRQRRVLYLSSCAVLDKDLDGYGRTKAQGEFLARCARDAGVPYTVVRPFSGYGEDQGVDWPFGAFVDRAQRRDDPFQIWGDGTQVRDWIHIDDVVRGALAVAESGTTEAVSLCTGVGTSMNALAQLIVDAAGYRPTFHHDVDRHAGSAHRVGDPAPLLRYYRPETTLEQGVARALALTEEAIR